MTIEMTSTPIDGRTRRRRRNLDAVVDAVIVLAGAGNLDPTSEEIASVAGVSHRSIYRYFDTRAELLEAAVARAFESVSAQVLSEGISGGSFDERVERFVEARVELYLQLRSIARVASAQASHTSNGLEQARSALRMRLVEHFATEFDRFDPEELLLVVPIIDAVFQFEALEYLSANAGLDDAAIRRALARHLRQHLG